MNSTPSCSEVNEVNGEIEAGRGEELLSAASKGCGPEVVKILEADPDLLRVGDVVGDTALHLFARAGNVDGIIQVIEFLHDDHRELITTVFKQQNGDGETALHLAVKSKHKEAALELFKVDSNAKSIRNEDGESPLDLINDSWGNDFFFEDNRVYGEDLAECLCMCALILRSLCRAWSNCYWMTRTRLYSKLLKPAPDYDQILASIYCRNYNIMTPVPCSYSADIQMQRRRENEQYYENNNTILVMLEANPSLIHHKNHMGNTILHEWATAGNIDMLTKLVMLVTTYWSHFDSQLQITKLNELLMDKNRDGDTALHLALYRMHEATARYLMEVVPETVYQVNHEGVSPLNLALKYEYHELIIKYAFQLMPTAAVSRSTIESMVASKKISLPHAAVKARNLTTLKMILEIMPSLIDSSDKKGWKPLSYAAYKGYVKEVGYFLNKFPESAEKFDSDGSFPIHKAVSGGHIDTIKEFISSHPQSLHVVDMKGRSVLHIAVRYAKADILAYLTQDTNSIQNILGLRDHDGKTFLDLAKELKHN